MLARVAAMALGSSLAEAEAEAEAAAEAEAEEAEEPALLGPGSKALASPAPPPSSNQCAARCMSLPTTWSATRHCSRGKPIRDSCCANLLGL